MSCTLFAFVEFWALMPLLCACLLLIAYWLPANKARTSDNALQQNASNAVPIRLS